MDTDTLPKHIGFIMDGNRRWARTHKFKLFLGHHKGAERIETVVEAAAKMRIPYLTFWAFSTENWNREQDEVDTLIEVFRDVLHGPIVKRMIENGVKLQVIGDYKAFPEDIVKQVEKLTSASKENSKITVNIALNYGGRAEIVAAMNVILNEVKNPTAARGSFANAHDDKLTEQIFSDYLSTKNQPDPDIIVRTGGEQRLSGFLPWQAVYSELYFTDTLWPDFDEKAFKKALREFSKRQRRFGK